MGRHHARQLPTLLVALHAAAVSFAQGQDVATSTFVPRPQSCPSSSTWLTTGMLMQLATYTNTTGVPPRACFSIFRSVFCDDSNACCAAQPTPTSVRLSVGATCSGSQLAWTLDGQPVAASRVSGGVQIPLRNWGEDVYVRTLCVTLQLPQGSVYFPKRHLSAVSRPARCTSLPQLCGGDSCTYTLASNTVPRASSAPQTTTNSRACCSQGQTTTAAAPPPRELDFGTGGPEIPEKDFKAANELTDFFYRFSGFAKRCEASWNDVDAVTACINSLQGASRADKEILLDMAALPLRHTTSKDYQSPVRSQGQCGTCVSYAAIDNVETNLRVTRQDPNANIEFSTLDAWKCHAGKTCNPNGWDIKPQADPERQDAISQYLAEKGAIPSICRKPAEYVNATGDGPEPDRAAVCPQRESNPQCNRQKFVEVPIAADANTVNWLLEIQSNTQQYGSAVTCFSLEDTDIGFFYFLNNKTLSSEKIYTGRIAQKLPTESGHCVNLVGYDNVDAFFVAKNSWGDDVHAGGYFKLGFEADVGAFTSEQTATFVPEGTLNNRRTAPLKGCTKHTVVAGETTFAIAVNYGVEPKKVLMHPDNTTVFKAAGSLAWPTPGAQLTVCA